MPAPSVLNNNQHIVNDTNNKKAINKRVINNENIVASKKAAAVTAQITAQQMNNNLKAQQKQANQHKKTNAHDFDNDRKQHYVAQAATTEQPKQSNLVKEQELSVGAALQQALHNFKAALDTKKFLDTHHVKLATAEELATIESDPVQVEQRNNWFDSISQSSQDDEEFPVSFEQVMQITENFKATVAGSLVIDGDKSSDEKQQVAQAAGKTVKDASAQLRNDLRSIFVSSLDLPEVDEATQAQRQQQAALYIQELERQLGTYQRAPQAQAKAQFLKDNGVADSATASNTDPGQTSSVTKILANGFTSFIKLFGINNSGSKAAEDEEEQKMRLR